MFLLAQDTPSGPENKASGDDFSSPEEFRRCDTRVNPSSDTMNHGHDGFYTHFSDDDKLYCETVSC